MPLKSLELITEGKYKGYLKLILTNELTGEEIIPNILLSPKTSVELFSTLEHFIDVEESQKVI